MRKIIELAGPMSSLLMAVALLMAGIGMFNTFLGLRADFEQFSRSTIGYMMSSFYLGIAIGTIKCPPLVNRIGHIRAFAAFSAACAITILVFPLYKSGLAWIVLRAIMGFSTAGLLVISESWLNARADVHTRGTLLSMYMMVGYMFYGCGQFLINIGEIGDSRLFMVATILVAMSLIPVAVTRATNPDPCESHFYGLRKLYAISPVAIIGSFVSGAVISGIYTMGAIYGQDVGLSLNQISVFMGIIGISGLALQFPIGRLSDRYDRRKVIFAVSGATLLISLMLSLGQHLSPVLLFVIGGVYGGVSSTMYPLCVAYANDYIQPEDMVRAASGLVLVYGMGAAVGPAIVTPFMSLLGPGALFLMPVCMTFGLCLVILHRARQRTVSEEEKEPFVPLPQAALAPIASEVDPRAEITESLIPDDPSPPSHT